jgi:signal transduction histidine kinase
VLGGVALAWQIAPDLPPLTTDPRKLKLVLKNLISNAVKFTEAGMVTVGVTADATGHVFDVCDTGTGIPREAHQLIFEPFRQVDGSDARRFGGVGLGLRIVKRVLTLLGGAIEVHSELGIGSTFRVRLPQPQT